MSNITPMRAGGGLSPIYPQSVEDAYRLAKMAFQAGMLIAQKKGYGDNAIVEDDDSVLARGTMIIMQGMEIGVPPMQAVQLLAMINGRITAHSEAVPGLLLAHGFKLKETWTGAEMQDDWTCTVELIRPNGDKYIGSFSVKDAKQAGLWDQSPTRPGYQGKTKANDSAWFRYPKRMLKARALGFAGKDGGADVLKGIAVREEIEDQVRVENMRDVTPVAQISPPDIPDEIPETPVDQTPTPDIPDETITDEAGFIEKLQSDYSSCDSEQEVAQLKTDSEALIKRLSKKGQKKAHAILEGNE
jgi:hypothetical protein